MSEFASLETQNALRLLNSNALVTHATDGRLLAVASTLGIVV